MHPHHVRPAGPGGHSGFPSRMDTGSSVTPASGGGRHGELRRRTWLGLALTVTLMTSSALGALVAGSADVVGADVTALAPSTMTLDQPGAWQEAMVEGRLHNTALAFRFSMDRLPGGGGGVVIAYLRANASDRYLARIHVGKGGRLTLSLAKHRAGRTTKLGRGGARERLALQGRRERAGSGHGGQTEPHPDPHEGMACRRQRTAPLAAGAQRRSRGRPPGNWTGRLSHGAQAVCFEHTRELRDRPTPPWTRLRTPSTYP